MPPGDGRVATARAGEDAAAAFLRARGWTLLARNFRTRHGELDIVADDGRALVFVEVKARRSVRAGLPQEAVDRDKRGRVRRMAEAYLLRATAAARNRPVRFDVLAVYLRGDGAPRVEHIQDAF